MKRFAGSRIVVLLVLMLLSPGGLGAPDPDRFRAAMIYHFTKFVRWPDKYLGASETFRLCIVGQTSVTSHLQSRNGKSVNGHIINVEQVEALESGCHVMLFGNNTATPQSRIPGSLTIGLSQGFLEQGGMVEIGAENKRIVFDVDLNMVRSEGLEMSAEMLNLARSVR